MIIIASSGYMTELDTESIWDTTLTTARFDLINVRMGEILNFKIRPDKDAQTDITDTKITPILEQISEEGLFRLIAAAKENAVKDPWLFIQANVMSVISQVYEENLQTIIELKEEQESKVHLKYSSILKLRSHSDN